MRRTEESRLFPAYCVVSVDDDVSGKFIIYNFSLPMLLPIQSELRNMADPEKARLLSGFFKTGLGQYGE